MKLLFTITVATVSLFSQNSTFDKDAFIKRVRSNYHSFKIDTTKKISSYLTTQSFNNYHQSKTTEDIKFPVTIDWSDIASISLDRTEDHLGTSDFKERQNQVLALASLFLQNWLDFSVNDLIPSKAINYSLSRKGKRVYFSYITQNGKTFDRIAKEFAMNGLLMDMSVQTSDKFTYHIQPFYRSIKGKWLCVGWMYQKVDQMENVLEGMKIELVQQQIGTNWYPFDARLTIQSAKSKNGPVLEQLFFRNYHLKSE